MVKLSVCAIPRGDMAAIIQAINTLKMNLIVVTFRVNLKLVLLVCYGANVYQYLVAQ